MARLGDICKFQSGGTPSKSNPLYFGGTIPWITTVALNGHVIDENNAVDWITEKAIVESAAKIVPANSIMIGTRVGVGKVAINSVPMSTSQDIISLLEVDETKWNKAFICKWLSAQSSYLQAKARGATIKGIKIEMISDLEIPEISIENQQFISACLDRVSQLISLRKRQLAKLDELVKARFVEMFGDININDKKWPIQPLGELCDIYRGGSPRPIEQFLGGTVPWIKIGDATSGDDIFLKATKEFIIEDGVKKSRLVSDGSLIFANCGVSLGFARIITFSGCIHDGWLSFENIDNRLNKVFLLKSLNQMTEHFRAIAPAGTQPNLNTAIMKEHKQIIPPLSLQEKYTYFVGQVIRKKLTIQQSLDKLEVMKKSLMQEYFG